MSECMLSPRSGSGGAKVKWGDFTVNYNTSGTRKISVAGVGFRPDIVIVYASALKGDGRIVVAVINEHANIKNAYLTYRYGDRTETSIRSYSFNEDGFVIEASDDFIFQTDNYYNRWHYIAVKA